MKTKPKKYEFVYSPSKHGFIVKHTNICIREEDGDDWSAHRWDNLWVEAVGRSPQEAVTKLKRLERNQYK